MEKKQSLVSGVPGFHGQIDTKQAESFIIYYNKYYDGKNYMVQWESRLPNSLVLLPQ